MSSTLIAALVALLAIGWAIIRQVQEQPVKQVSWLIFLGLITYLTYTRAIAELINPPVAPIFLLTAMAVGLLAGALLGFYRAGLAHMRRDATTGVIYAKASVLSIVIWLLVFVLRIATFVASYMPHLHASVLLALLVGVMSTLFLGNIAAERATLYWRAVRWQHPAEQRVSTQQSGY